MIDVHNPYFLIDVHHLTFLFLLPQKFPKPDLEKLLASRVKFHAEHREDLRTALKTYLNNGKPVIEDGGGGVTASVDDWNDTLEDD